MAFTCNGTCVVGDVIKLYVDCHGSVFSQMKVLYIENDLTKCPAT